MAGHIRTLQKCPKCRGKFRGQPLACPECLTIPTRFFIDLWWQGRIKIYTDPQGHPLDSWGRTFTLLATITEQITTGKFDPADYVAREIKGLQFDNYCRAWLERRREDTGRPGGISRAYFKELRRYARKFFIPLFARTSIRDLRAGNIEDFNRKLPSHLSAKTRRNILGVLHQLLSNAHSRGDIFGVPNFPAIAREEPLTLFLLEPDQETILAQCREPYRTLFLLAMKHGLRAGEARALKWDKVDLKRSLVTIAAGFDLGEWKPYTKEKEVRILHLHSRVREALLALPRSLTGFVFVNSQGRPLSQRMVTAHWQRARDKAGININCHQGTRHSFASQKAIAGYSLHQIGAVLGHSTPAMTKRYAKVVTAEMVEMIEGPHFVRNLSANKKHPKK